MRTREQFMGYLKPLIPETWSTFDYPAQLDNLSKVTLSLGQSKVRRSPSAPKGWDDANLTLTVISPNIDPQHGENTLEDALDTTLSALEKITGISFVIGDADRRVYRDKFPCYDIEITLPTTRKKAP
jgi:hypothetical protein